MKKFFAMLLAAVMLASCACFAMADESTTITVWHRWSGANEAYLNEVLDAFHAAHPEVKIEVSAKAGEYFELLQSMIADAAAGNPLPDIFVGGYNLLNYIATEMNPVPVNELAPSEEAYEAVAGKFLDTTLALGQWDGVQVGLPIACSTMVMYVNMDIFAEAGLTEADIPETWEQLEEVCKVIKEKTGHSGTGIQLPDNWGDQALIFSAGGELLSEDKAHVDFTNEGMVKAISMWQRLYNEGYIPLCTNNELYSNFTAGDVAMYFTSVMSLATLSEYCAFDMDVCPVPAFEGHQKQLPVGGAAMISFSKDADKKAAVWSFLDYFANEGVKTFVKTGYLNPTTTEVEVVAGQEAAYAQMDSVRPWECWPGGSAGLEIDTMWISTRTDIIQNNVDVVEALTSLTEECNMLLDF